jgi:hypothetical protein
VAAAAASLEVGGGGGRFKEVVVLVVLLLVLLGVVVVVVVGRLAIAAFAPPLSAAKRARILSCNAKALALLSRTVVVVGVVVGVVVVEAAAAAAVLTGTGGTGAGAAASPHRRLRFVRCLESPLFFWLGEVDILIVVVYGVVVVLKRSSLTNLGLQVQVSTRVLLDPNLMM